MVALAPIPKYYITRPYINAIKMAFQEYPKPSEKKSESAFLLVRVDGDPAACLDYFMEKEG
jgi:hypothetical protein